MRLKTLLVLLTVLVAVGFAHATAEREQTARFDHLAKQRDGARNLSD